jgi:tetratricopeptide (TPR) repeat protein/Cdc6-like AAA superfamily ATPase
MIPKIKGYLEAMEGTVKHIRAMSTTRHITQLQESRIGELGVREREIIMDGSEKAIFPVDNLPTHRTAHFTGRRKEIDRIHAWLGVEQNTRLRTFLIYGRRGIGKTQIALEYAARYKTPMYDAIFWIQCETSASLRNSFAEIATALELDGADKNGHFEENLMKVLRWLKHTKKRWLLIYDNAERENLLKGYWPVGARGSMLLTSRSPYNFFEDDQRQGETVPVFSIEESDASLMAQLGQDWQTTHLGAQNMLADVEKAAAKTLLHQTGGLPLAIHHAAKLILNKKIGMKRERDQGDDTIHGFLELFRESHLKLPKRQTGDRDPLIHSLDTIWSIAFDALSMNARAILSVLALVSPDVILIDLFLPGDQERLTEKLAFCKPDPTDVKGHSTVQTAIKMSPALQEAIDELVHQGMVAKTGRNLTIHREVQEAVNYQSIGELQAAFDTAVNLLYDAFPQQKEGRPMTDDKETCRRWLQHVIALTNKYNVYSKGRPENDFPLDGMKSRRTFVKLLANCAWYLFEIADYEECLNIINTARSACDDQQSLDYAHLLNTESTTYFEQNRLRQSREAAEVARAIRGEKLSPDSADYAIVLANLGNIETAQGNYSEALKLLEEAAGIRYQIGDDAAVMLALNYLQIGRVFFLQGEYTRAYNSYQQCEGVFMKKAGRNSWFLADLHYAYGNLEFAQDDFQSAGKSYERARRICMEQNPLHPLTAAVFYKLACTEFEQDHHTKALGNIEKAMSIAEVRSPNVTDGTLARILWKKAEIMLDGALAGPQKLKEAQDLKDGMELKQREIAENLEVELRGFEDDDDREKSFDLLVAGYYR